MRANQIKRYISFLMCTIMLIGSMPLSIMATPQKHVKIKSIKAVSGNTDPTYSFLLEWTNPDWGTEPSHQARAIRISERNATAIDSTFNVLKEVQNNQQNVTLTRDRLNSGSIYEYKVTPYHTHTNTDGSITEAPYDSTTPEESALFMTDIKVDAKGYGNTLEVTFDNPTYDGKNIFTGYRIYYQQGGAGVGNDSFNSQIDVSIDNTDLIPSKDENRNVNRITYKITNENIKPATIFAVKVEPLYNGTEIRKDDSSQVSIDNKTKKISFNSKKFVQYRTNDAYVSIPLNVVEDGRDYLKLQWGDISGIITVGTVEKIEILSGSSSDQIENIIGTIHGPTDVVNINSWRILKPTQTTYFKVRFTIKNSSTPIESEIAMYDPNIVNVTPNKPNIYPKVNIANNKSVIDLYWDTFIRPPYNKDEEANLDENGLFFDTNVVYDVWITDSLANLNRLGLPKIMDKVSATEIETTNIKEATNKVFYKQITEYVTIDETGAFITKPLEQNKTYYIRIVATKPTSDGLGLSSDPANSQIYVSPSGDISNPKTLSKPPFRVKKDENGNDVINQNDITVEWNTKWFEVYDEETDTWYSSAALRDGKLIFGKEIKDTDKIIQFYDKQTQEDVRLAFSQAGYTGASSLVIRDMDISSKDIEYEMIVVPFDEINQNGGYEQYIERLLQSESEQWKQIQPTFTEEIYAEYLVGDLEENTTYAILLRPYRILEDGKKDAYPTYLLATTLPKDTDVEITPVIPTLYEVSKTDMSIEVEWQNLSNKIVYELAIDENVLDDPSSASMLIDSQNIKDNSSAYNKDDGREFLKYNIQPLFPDTGYYIWIRAIVEGTDRASDWSTPLYVRTNNIQNPEPPSGFGLASEKSLSTYNTNNNKDYKPITDKYLVLEWLRDLEDLLADPKANGGETTEPLLDPNLKKTYMVKFNELIANRYYYTRAKTKVTISKGSDGTIEKFYSYIVELSPNEDFKDAIEIEIPTVEPKGDRVLTAESEWTTTFRYRTSFSTDGSGDYDGNIIDDLYPLPTEDFEILYDYLTKTLTYRFRSNKTDENGNADNLVDQRFITKLINNKVYNYNIDLTSHNGYTIKNRKVEIPYSIISAFEQRKISLSITTGGTRFTLNPAFLNTPEVKNIGKLNMNTTVLIEIMQNPDGLPVLNYNQVYATTPEYIKISLDNNGVYTPLSYTGSDMDIFLKLKNRSLTIDNNVLAYRNINNNLWESVPSIYNSETGIHTVKTNRLGKYTTIANSVKETNINNNNDTNILVNINNKIVFTDLNNVNMKDPISVVQFNNIVSGIANGKKEITINGGLSEQDYQSLQRSGMLLQGSVVGREAGINTLVKLYETKTKSKYEPVDNINTTPYKDIINANKAYQTNLIKAGEIGFYGEATSVNPKNVMTIEEMFYIIDIILSDSGY